MPYITNAIVLPTKAVLINLEGLSVKKESIRPPSFPC